MFGSIYGLIDDLITQTQYYQTLGDIWLISNCVWFAIWIIFMTIGALKSGVKGFGVSLGIGLSFGLLLNGGLDLCLRITENVSLITVIRVLMYNGS